MCSTPEGITTTTTQGDVAGYRLDRCVLNAGRHHDDDDENRPCNLELGDKCSTPEGITTTTTV